MAALPFHNYCVSFSDGTFKTGISSKPFYRLQDYIQEAHRHSIKVNGFQITAPSKDKATALKIEKEMCNRYSGDQIIGHREWFKPDDSWMDEKSIKKLIPLRDRSNDFFLFSYDMGNIWKRHNFIQSLNLGRNKNPYKEMIELAKELGECGGRIKAKLATELTSIGNRA